MIKWMSLNIMWVIGLWYLKTPPEFYSIIKDKVIIGYLFIVAWRILSNVFLSKVKSISIIMLMPFIGGLLNYLIAYNGSDKKELYFLLQWF